MLGYQKFARHAHIETKRLRFFIDRGWISPKVIDGHPVFRDVDMARANLIADLTNELGINDEGVDVVLELLDQLYGLRLAFGTLIDALEVQPRGIKRHVVNDAQKLKALTYRRSRAGRPAL
ncbi:chaperone modulator CbpM [Mesorhizobium sp. AR10]|uniref:chaperone modulator CbpM n=1 Tax=Mesorhizobium sp. AR10 TaxID=2865839 RepID=UPI0021601BA4|nr:chaperone modulator CbpM [Mesorhizobium sp. AR10]UVK41014.1 chaperone modulator CbpM [Mesorhizobium sp. AR10]